MKCACLVDPDVDDQNTWDEKCNAKHIVSKTIQKCIECGRTIFSGEQYLFERVNWDDDRKIDEYITCRDCESLRENLCCNWIYTMVLEDIQCAFDCIEDDLLPWATFAKLTPAAKDFIFNLIEDRWADNE